jgi:hypothetical protein
VRDSLPAIVAEARHAGYVEGFDAALAEAAERVRGLPMTFGQHTCWDDHEGGVDLDGIPTLHADGTACGDRLINESVSRAAVLAILEER